MSAHVNLDSVALLSLTALTLKLASIDVQYSAATVTSCVHQNAATVKRRRLIHVDAPEALLISVRGVCF